MDTPPLCSYYGVLQNPMMEGPGRDFLIRTITALSVCLLAFAIATAGVEAAQDPQPRVAPAPADQAELDARAQTLKQWVDDFTRWKRLRDEKGTDRNARQLPPKPEPPAWLSDDCRDVAVDDTGVWADACRLLTDWKDDELTARIRRQITDSRAQREAPTKSIWWQRVHVDALWPMTQWGSSVYGIVGTHVTVEVAGRFQVFVAPGAMLLNVPGEGGRRDWKMATDWGVAYRLLDFKFPGTERHTQLHANLVTAWVFSGSTSLAASRINLVGFSFTFKQP
jgi:hypothetical protein